MATFDANLIEYVVQRVKEEEGTLSKTKLVKLLYLVDIENYRMTGKTLTGWQWRFHHYGPYAFEIENVIDKMPFGFDQDEVVTSAGRHAFSYTSDARLNELEGAFTFGDRALIDKVVKTWALENLNTVLDYVYFETEPMKDVQRGDVLDFTKISIDRPSYRTSPGTAITHARLKELKRNFQKLMSCKRQPIGIKITPAPYDDVYFEALKTMEKD